MCIVIQQLAALYRAYGKPCYYNVMIICASVIIPAIMNIVNLSLSSGHFHPLFKQSVVSPLLKKIHFRQ